jgi:putative zinc finger/helix-turn-helix YgiT family protein
MERKAMTCNQCGGKQATRRENYLYAACGLPNVTLVGVEVRRCANCGDHEVVIPRIEELHRVLAAAVVRQTSRLTKDEIRFLRKYLGYSGVDFAKVVGVSPETVSRWENGKEKMGSSAEKLVRMLVVHTQPTRHYSIESLAKISERPLKPSPRPIGVRIKGVNWVEQEIEAA